MMLEGRAQGSWYPGWCCGMGGDATEFFGSEAVLPSAHRISFEHLAELQRNLRNGFGEKNDFPAAEASFLLDDKCAAFNVDDIGVDDISSADFTDRSIPHKIHAEQATDIHRTLHGSTL
jgi:hypothetical protein